MQKTDYHFIYHKVGTQEMVFEISDEDLAGDPSYFGYLSENGSWIIQQRNAASGTYRYCAGASLYAANWAARAGLTYELYNEI